jgi:hypothetical protein
MIDPSGLRLPDDAEFRIERIAQGLYSVVNAYDGEYEYFDERPIKNGIGDPSGILGSEVDVVPSK